MSDEQPFSLSAVVPTHGGRTSVAKTVSALLAEPSEFLEVIVVSDGDPEPAMEALAQIDDRRLKLISQPKRGSAAARNLGLSQASNHWVAFVDDDDVPRPNWFDVWATHAHDNHVVLTACVKHWEGDDVLSEKRCCPLDASDPTMGASRLLAGAFVTRKAVLEAIGGYDLALRASQNQDLGLRLLAHLEEAGREDGVLNTGHVVIDVFTEKSSTRRRRYGGTRADAAKTFQERFPERLAADPKHAASLHRIIARSALDIGDIDEFRRAARRALWTEPTNWANWRFFLASASPRLAGFVSKRMP